MNTCIDCGISISRGSKRCKPCYYKSITGAKNSNYTGSTVCPKCGDKKKRGVKLCRECWRKYMPRGKDSPQWKGGITKKYLRHIQGTRDNLSLGYINWRKEIFKRDNFTCQHCQRKSGKLVGHHIKNFKENDNLRLDIKNGITLCQKCHQLFHSLFGQRNNNLGQLNWFFKNVKLNKGENSGC